MKEKILTHKVSRGEWPAQWYFRADRLSSLKETGEGFRTTGTMRDGDDNIRFYCFLCVDDESVYTIKERW